MSASLFGSTEKLAKKLEQADQIEHHVSGVNSAAKSYLISGIPLFRKYPVFWFVADEKHAQQTALSIKIWNTIKSNGHDTPVTAIPDCLLEDLASNEQRSLTEALHSLLLASLNRQPGFYIIPASLLGTRLPTKSHFQNQSLQLDTAQNYQITELVNQLVSGGYEPEQSVWQPGDFARKGGILEIFPVGATNPLRLELNSAGISRCEWFNKRTKKVLQKIKEVSIAPLKISSRQSTLLDYLDSPNKSFLIFEDPEILSENIDPWGKEGEKLWQKSEAHFSRFRKIVFHSFPQDEQSDFLRLDFSSPPLYQNNAEFLIRDVKKALRRKQEVFLLTNDCKELNGKLNSELKRKVEILELPADKLIPYGVVAGFNSPSEKILVLTDYEIKGPQPSTSSKKPNTSFLKELKRGGFVVHLDHGVGRFLGMQRNIIEGVRKEYFALEYAAKDRLFVPVEAADKLTKFVGGRKPTLHRLSDDEWLNQKTKATKQTEKLAKELLAIASRRELAQRKAYQKSLSPEEKVVISDFPFTETGDQIQALNEIRADLSKSRPMDRLLVGDVGFGKTEVALRTALQAVNKNVQVAILAPTTILVEQHFRTFQQRLKKLPLEIASLSRFQSASRQREVIKKIQSGKIKIVIGTHRLFSQDVKFKKLGLLILDEEQRFGVKQKEHFKKLRSQVDILSLSATPIPRTLNLSLAGVRQISSLETPPPGRLPIQTFIAPYSDEKIKEAVNFELKRKGQVYLLHNRVETMPAFARKMQRLLPQAKITTAHGQLPEQQLAKVMDDFLHQKSNVLIASTIIENGLDIPTVNTLVVDDAAKLGLAQMHQLRGRIGRGERKAYAYFLYQQKSLKGQARARLQALIEASELGSGFELARRDLEIRGAGNILGAEQSGQINSVGLGLYLRLLSRAVDAQKSKVPRTPRLEVVVDLPLESRIPDSYVPDSGTRYERYQILADSESLSSLKQARSELTKQFGVPPQTVRNLFRVLEIRILASEARVLKIDTQSQAKDKHRLVLEFAEDPPYRLIHELQKKQGHWELKNQSLRVELSDLGEDWLPKLKQALTLLGRQDN